jgi:HAD superfamily hydrolase (TIGR01509 family)
MLSPPHLSETHVAGPAAFHVAPRSFHVEVSRSSTSRPPSFHVEAQPSGASFAPSTPMTALRAVLLDVDGTLVDSNDAHAASWQAALEQFGHRVAFARVRALIGKGGDKLIQELVGIDVESATGQQIEKLRGQLFTREYLPKLRPFPRVRELLLRLREDNLCLVVATSAKSADMDALLEITGAQDLVHERTSADDANNSKPDPDIIHAALKQARANPSESLMLGDTPYDIQAASRAGVRTVALRCGGWQDDDLQGAVAIYQDAADLLRHYATSPFTFQSQ